MQAIASVSKLPAPPLQPCYSPKPHPRARALSLEEPATSPSPSPMPTEDDSPRPRIAGDGSVPAPPWLA